MSWTRQATEALPDTPTGRVSASPPGRATDPIPGPNVNIGPSIHIKGTVTGSEDLVIEGAVEGTICLDRHTLTVGRRGVIHADISARAVRVHGEVTGDLTATDRIEIAASGSVCGDLHAPRVAVLDGARFRGAVDMGERSQPRQTGEEEVEDQAAAAG